MKKSMNSSGKVLTIFAIIFAILLSSLTAVSFFFFKKEESKRLTAELKVQEAQTKYAILDKEMIALKKENFLLEEKYKEADERIDDLTNELELEDGLREELKKEVLSLKSQLQESEKIKNELQAAADSDQTVIRERIAQLESQLKIEKSLKEDLENKMRNFRAQKISSIPVEPSNEDFERQINQNEEAIQRANDEIQLEDIVVLPETKSGGRILSVDKETEFVIVNMGEKDGLTVGNILSVYRGEEYLGDIRITRLQPEMSAADLIPPFSSQKVRKNDQVVLK